MLRPGKRRDPVIAAYRSEQVRRKRQEADVGATPAGALERGTLVAAGGAPSASSKLVARGVGSPADDGHGAGDRRRVPALHAVEPQPRCGAVQVAERRGGAQGFHGRDWTPAELTKSSR
jgi:hypothetical protein